eukprot:UN09501
MILNKYSVENIPKNIVLKCKKYGFSDQQIARVLKSTENEVRRMRIDKYGIRPWVKQIDTLAAEFPAFTNYLYVTYNGSEHDLVFNEKGVIVLGCGAYRIGSSCEFDWCAVSAVRTVRQLNEIGDIEMKSLSESSSYGYNFKTRPHRKHKHKKHH